MSDTVPNSRIKPARPPQDFWPDTAELIRSEAFAPGDMAIRWILVGLASLALTYAMEQWIFVAWGVLYIVVDAAYLGAIRHTRPPVYLPRYAMILAMNIVTSSLYVAMPVYLILHDQPGLVFIGVCGFLGLCLHNLVRHRGLNHIAIWDLIVCALGTALILVIFLQSTSGLTETVLILAGGLGLSAYFITGYLGTLKIRGRLALAETITPEAQKMEAVGRLTGGVAHDFNNILTVILGNLDLYDELQQGAERDQVVAEAREAAFRAATLTAQLLSFSRRATLLPEDIPVAPFLEQFGEMCRRILPANIEFTVSPGGPKLTTHADPNQLSTALLNLVINARDAMPEGGRLTLTARRHRFNDATAPDRGDGTPLNGGYAAISVCDTGPGIPELLLPEVRTPFFTTKALGKGSGLGLSMVDGFAEQTHGHLELENRKSGGVKATIYLPETGPDATAALTAPIGPAQA